MDASLTTKLESLLKSEGYLVAEQRSTDQTHFLFAAKGDLLAQIQITQGVPVLGQAVNLPELPDA
jgi:hypothetical protein